MNSILNKVLISFAALFLFAPIVNASVVINEIQISPINERFIELYNPDNSDTDLTGWYIQRKTATGASFSSLVTSTQLNNKIIKSHGYFLISRSQLGNSDVVVDNLTLTEANTIRIRDSKGKDVDQIEWETIDEGKSYQRVLTGEWVIATSTPRAVNSRAESTSTSSTQTSGTNPAPVNSEPPSSASNSSWPVEQQIFANAGPDKTATVGADMVFEGKALGLEKKPIENARFLWNFGDGTTKEGKSVLYAYKYPGEYIVVLDVSSGYFSASDRVLIKAENSKIIISSLGTSQNNFIELTNPSNYDIDISLWMLRSGMTTFFLPARTYIAGNKKLIFASDTTKIIPQKGERVELLYPNGSLATLFELSGAGKNIVSSGSANSNRAPALLVIENTVKSAVTPEGGTTSQMAAAVNPLAQNSAPSMYKWLLGLAAVALVSIFGVSYASYSPRTKKESAPQAKDFKIIEEE